MDTKDLVELAAEISRKSSEEKRRRARRIARLAIQARKEVDRLMAAFKEVDPELQTVILFGSPPEDRIRSEQFDIDMAISSRKCT